MGAFTDWGGRGKAPYAEAIGNGCTDFNTVHAQADRRVCFSGTAERRGGVVGGPVHVDRAGLPWNIVYNL